jgi:plasmid stabilization system protein ParE
VIIVSSRRAIAHLAHLHSFIACDKAKAALKITDTLLDAVERLGQQPNLGAPCRSINGGGSQTDGSSSAIRTRRAKLRDRPRQAEQWKQLLRVEERVPCGNLVASELEHDEGKRVEQSVGAWRMILPKRWRPTRRSRNEA